MKNPQTLNGINTDELHSAVNDVKKHPDHAHFKFCATHSWVDGFHGQTKIDNFTMPDGHKKKHNLTFVFEADEPPVLLGKDEGANATEAALHALASCLNATLVYHATLKNIKVEQVRFDLEGDIDLNGFLGTSNKERNGYRKINVICKVKADATKQQIQRLCELAQEHSPVFDIISNPVPVSVKLEKFD